MSKWDAIDDRGDETDSPILEVCEFVELPDRWRSMPSGAARSKLQRKIRELSRRKSKRAHGADQHSKFSWIPIIPEAPLAFEGGFALPEVTDILIDAAAALAF
jgi:hypothetical protein